MFSDSSVFDSDSEWAPFCDEELFFKPYVRIREGRIGPVIKDMGPGLFEVRDMENLYVCANGLIFLYFKINEKEDGEVYDDAVMQYASHYCGFFNGKPGPEISQRVDTLVAILLVGHSQDYRQIFLQMFTAPLYNPSTKTTSNFTSLVIINTDGECILEKGNERARIRVKGNPSEEIQKSKYEAKEEHYITLCRLDGHLLMENDATNIPLNYEWTSREEALKALTQSQDLSSDLSFMDCYKLPLLDSKQVEIIGKRMNDTTKEGFDIGNGKSEWNPEDGAGVNFWTAERIEKYGNPATTTPEDETTLESDVITKNDTLNTELAKDEIASDATEIQKVTDELHLAILKLKLVPYLQHYQNVFESAKTAAKNATEAWEKVSTVVQDAILLETLTNYTEILEKLSLYHQQKLTEPYNTKNIENFEDAKVYSAELKELIWEKTLELGPQITIAEVMSARRGSFVEEVKSVMDQIKKLILAFETSKLNSQWDFQQPTETYKDTVVSIKNPTAGAADDNPACLTFERKQDQCKFVKPSGKHACQLAKMMLNGASSDWPGGAGDSWRDEVLDFLDQIFTKGCSRLQGNFARGINNIIKGYLIKKPAVEADKDVISGSPFINRTRQNFITNYKISKLEDLQPLLPQKDAAPWDEILEKLGKCRERLQPLDFTVESSSNAHLRIFFNGKLLPKVVEQADMEYSFNWAVDSNFRIFATVLGLCAKEMDDALAKKFYEGYMQAFLDPIRSIWISNRDNPILKVVLGQYYITGKGDLWTRQCMEASYIHSGKPQMRPVRNILVNSYTEPNFIAMGPGQGTRGPFYAAE